MARKKRYAECCIPECSETAVVYNPDLCSSCYQAVHRCKEKSLPELRKLHRQAVRHANRLGEVVQNRKRFFRARL